MENFTITIGGRKGGVGKSTTACNLAAELSKKGYEVLLVDTDEQHTTRDWADRRKEDPSLPQIQTIQLTGKTIGSDLRGLQSKYQLILIDAGGRATLELKGAMLASDLAIIPIVPSQPDLDTLQYMADFVEDAKLTNTGLMTKVLINMASTNHNERDTAGIRGVITQDYTEFEMLESVVRQRKIYRTAYALGRTIYEIENDWKAKQEFDHLLGEVESLIKEVVHGV